MTTAEVILTISGEVEAVKEISRHIENVSNLCNCKVEVRAQSTDDLKKENAAIHKQCYKEQKKITAILKHLFENNHEVYNEICGWKDEDFERRYAEPVGTIKKY